MISTSKCLKTNRDSYDENSLESDELFVRIPHMSRVQIYVRRLSLLTIRILNSTFLTNGNNGFLSHDEKRKNNDIGLPGSE